MILQKWILERVRKQKINIQLNTITFIQIFELKKTLQVIATTGKNS